MDDAVKLDRLIHPRVLLRSVVLDDFAAEVERQDVVRRQRAERRAKAVHQHAVGRDHNADVPGIGRAHSGAKQNARRTADVELDLIEVDAGWGYRCGAHRDSLARGKE